jgi:hypothetical protein
MRPLILTFLALAALAASAAEPAYPLWDGQETIAEYAKRTGLEPTMTLDLGKGVELQLVLIPSGVFTKGSPEVKDTIQLDITITAAGVISTMVLLVYLIVFAVRRRRYPQYTLRWIILLVLALGVAQYGALRWWRGGVLLGNNDYSSIPAHEATIPMPFYIGRYEVTEEQFGRVVSSYLCGIHDCPAAPISWYQAKEFCSRISQMTGQYVRLPSETEWEFACRAGTKTAYYTGDAETNLGRAAWYKENSDGKAHPVGQKEPNRWGLYDMHGNVWEWCEDAYKESYDQHSLILSGGMDGAQFRSLRGGGWDCIPRTCRSSRRCGRPPEYSAGFRVVIEVAVKDQEATPVTDERPAPPSPPPAPNDP